MTEAVTVLYTAHGKATGGREGTATSGNQNLKLSTPKELGGAGGEGTNPEELFAMGYAACFIGALKAVGAGQKIAVPADTSILDAVQAAGVKAPASCRIGNCGTCAVDVLAGTPDHRDEALSEEERAQGRMCICVSRAQGTELTLDL